MIQILTAPLPMQLPYAPGKVADGSSSWVPAIQHRSPDGTLDSWLQPTSASANSAIQGVNQQMADVCHSAFQIKLNILAKLVNNLCTLLVRL